MIAALLRVFETPLGPSPLGFGPNLGLLVLRVALGGSMLLFHGLSKAESFGTMKDTFPDPLGVGSPASLGLVVFAEVLCAALLVVGFFTRLAAIPLIVTMAVAVFLQHGNDPWSERELPLLYLAGFAAVFFLGAGRASLDSAILTRSPRG